MVTVAQRILNKPADPGQARWPAQLTFPPSTAALIQEFNNVPGFQTRDQVLLIDTQLCPPTKLTSRYLHNEMLIL